MIAFAYGITHAPHPEDLAFIGEIRRCARCDQGTPMYWIPDREWERVPERHRRQHICFGCYLQVRR